MNYIPYETVLATTKQIDFPDAFRLKRGQLVIYVGEVKTPAGQCLLAMCTDGQTRLVHADEVQEHDLTSPHLPSASKGLTHYDD